MWDIFCRVVDNFGDAAICWRLARQLSVEHGVAVRLWVDDLLPLRRLIAGALPGVVDGVEVCWWREPFADVVPGEVVVGAFACEVPAGYLQAMALRGRQPVWLNLEYLSAEAWVEECHGLGSTHPRLGVVQHFFFPGFAAGTGGLLRERDLLAHRAAFMAEPQARYLCRRAMVACPPASAQEPLWVSLFSYENPAIPSLLNAWANGGQPMVCVLPEGRALPQVAAWAERPGLAVGDAIHRGWLSLYVLPFVSQTEYDELLWCCDINFVRGEDSCVRAQWAALPFVWHIYPQQDGAHWAKLEAFLERYLAGQSGPEAAAIRKLWRDWNAGEDVEAAWGGLLPHLDALGKLTAAWAEHLGAQPDLASQLVVFCSERL